jgi:hypothetical protein
MPFVTALRRATKVLVTLASQSGAGKTYSSLLLARGLVGPTGKIGLLDTENERALIYADDPDIGGFEHMSLYPPFSPAAFIAAIDEAEEAGVDVLVIDSGSHEWNGIGGCIEMAEARDPTGKLGPLAWVKPKAMHRRFVNRLLQAQCHVIICLRADFKLVPAGKDDRGKQQWATSDELIAEQEKRFVYEATLSAVIDHATHNARWVKLPKPLVGALPDGEQIGADTGSKIAAWVAGGAAVDKVFEAALATLREAAQSGEKALATAFKAVKDRDLSKRLRPHAVGDLLGIARRADLEALETAQPKLGSSSADGNPLDDDVLTLIVNGEPLHYADPKDLERDFASELDGVPIEKRGAFWDDNEPLFAMLRQRDLASVADKLLELREAA